MANEKKIIVEQDICDLIERYQYEMIARKEIIAFMLESGMNTDTNSFKAYEKEYLEYFVKYNEAKNQLEQLYIIPVLGKVQNWNLNFRTRELTVNL